MNRAIVLWDFSNFVIHLERTYGHDALDRFDLEGFSTALLAGKHRIRIYLVGSEGRFAKDEAAFFEKTDRLPYFYVKSFQRRADHQGNEREKQVDVYLATELVALAYENAYDIAYLISGDEDFVPAIERAQAKGKQVVAVTFRGTMSKELRRKADEVIELAEGRSDEPTSIDRFIKEALAPS